MMRLSPASGGAERNPYRPTPGAPPVVLAGREAEIAFLLARLEGSPEIPADVRLTGLRGMGKTVLLKRFHEEAEERDWVVASVELDARFNFEAELIGLLTAVSTHRGESLSALVAARRALGAFAGAVIRSVNITVGDWTASLDPKFGEATLDLARPIVELVETTVDAGKAGCLYTIDEAQFLADDPDGDEFPLSLLLSTFAQLQSAGFPIALILSGLPDLDKELGRTRPQTERLFRGLAVDRLDDAATTEAFLGPLRGTRVSCDGAVLDAIGPDIGGYPHFIQVFGAELWEAVHSRGRRRITRAVLEAALPAIHRRIDVDIYDFRMRQLSPAERDLLVAASERSEPPFTREDLTAAAPSGLDVESAIHTLAQAGVIADPADRGEYSYTVPSFHRYLLRKGGSWRSSISGGS